MSNYKFKVELIYETDIDPLDSVTKDLISPTQAVSQIIRDIWNSAVDRDESDCIKICTVTKIE